MSKISELSFKEAIKLAKRIKVKGGVGAKLLIYPIEEIL